MKHLVLLCYVAFGLLGFIISQLLLFGSEERKSKNILHSWIQRLLGFLSKLRNVLNIRDQKLFSYIHKFSSHTQFYNPYPSHATGRPYDLHVLFTIGPFSTHQALYNKSALLDGSSSWFNAYGGAYILKHHKGKAPSSPQDVQLLVEDLVVMDFKDLTAGFVCAPSSVRNNSAYHVQVQEVVDVGKPAGTLQVTLKGTVPCVRHDFSLMSRVSLLAMLVFGFDRQEKAHFTSVPVHGKVLVHSKDDITIICGTLHSHSDEKTCQVMEKEFKRLKAALDEIITHQSSNVKQIAN